MKTFALLIMVLMTFSCAKDDSQATAATPPPNQGEQERGTPAPTPTPVPQNWTRVTERTQCEALNPLFCKGLWGFSVDHMGAYKIGPNSSGQVLTGHVSDQEFSDLSKRIDPVFAFSSLSSCEPADRLPGSSDQVSVASTNGFTFTAYNWQGAFGKTCYRGHASDAKALHETLSTIMLHYYPAQF